MVLNGCHSGHSVVESGVSEGSVLGPLLFLIYTNDLERNIKSNIKFFADDSMLFSIVNHPIISSNELNHGLDILYQWAHLEFNPDPSRQANEVLFSCKKLSQTHPHFIVNRTVVFKVSEHKHLGLILGSDLSIDKHFNKKSIKKNV